MSPPKTFQEAEVGHPCRPQRTNFVDQLLPKSIYDRATKLEFAADFSSAFHLYLEATDAFLHLSRSSVATPAFQAQCKARAAKAIQRAEKIKKASKTPGSQLGVVLAPVNCFGAGEGLMGLLAWRHSACHRSPSLCASKVIDGQ
ncbi:hypothetical protein L210DRAFT_2571527 [Boletus edulis BED1]|uniref:Uncharacterized protein n=1 Tax=Boletus edulis BED1 TaxID=1328754 RepID=A0AAD4BBU0_BOLED|nr:hypothetical protein L210DRAFT_2571527 [Boletus edulis BED1]